MTHFRRISNLSIAIVTALAGLIFVAVLAPVISNNRPVVVIDDSGLSFPVFSKESFMGVKGTQSDVFTLHPPIPYAPSDIDLENAGVPPLTFPKEKKWYRAHWLGTDEIGRDVLAQLIHGCRSSVIIALGAMSIALIVGLSLGAIGGYWHQRRMSIAIPTALMILIFIPFAFNGMRVISHHLSLTATVIFTLLGIASLGIAIGFFNRWVNRLMRRVFSQKTLPTLLTLHPDSWVMGLTNFFTTIPAYFALLAFLAIWSTPDATSISMALGFLMWPDITRLTRSAIIQLRESGMAEAAESLGYSPTRIVLYHLLPNALQPALVAFGFGIGGAIMAESFLSFVGIAPAEMVSWGTLLAKTRAYPEMWWLSVFPGTAIFFAILVFYRLSRSLEKSLGQTV